MGLGLDRGRLAQRGAAGSEPHGLVIWAAMITVLGLKRILGVPVWLGVVLNVVWVAAGWPLDAVVMHSPV